VSATKRPSAVDGLRRGAGTARSETDREAAAGQATPPNPYLEADLRNVPPDRPPKPVRFTLDLDQERHAFLKSFALECGAGIGGAQVMRALLDELRDGANLPMRVRARIWAEKR